MLPPLPRGSRPFFTAPEVSLAAFERIIAQEDDEVAAAFDLEGRLLLLPRRGTPVRVDFYEEEVERLAGAVVTHVHPLGGPFSGADALFASDNDVAEMRIVLPSGVLYRIFRPDQGWPDAESLATAAERRFDAVKRTPAMTENEFDRLMFKDQRDAFAGIGVTMVKESWR